jgi:TATA-binding protein-associated factor
MQAMDRAHRLGQKKVVSVYRLLMKGTLEERIMSLQKFKRDVAGAVVNADNVATNKMDTGSVVELMAGAAAVGGATGAPAGGVAGDEAAGRDDRDYADVSMSAFLKRVQGEGAS